MEPGLKQQKSASGAAFSETLTWSQIGATWKQLYGAFEKMGVSFEWHQFSSERPFEWSRSFHPESLEICLNLSGDAVVQGPNHKAELTSQSAVFYWTSKSVLYAERAPKQKHEFITIEFSPEFLGAHLPNKAGLHSILAAALNKSEPAMVSPVTRLSTHHQELIKSLRRPPVYRWAQHTWYLAKALEVASIFFFEPPPEEDLFCHRQQFMAQERVDKVRKILRENLAEPPSLEEIAKRVGCSAFYLSRTFSKETGSTIPQFVRKIRMEKAAELLKSGKFNVTEAALEVGYSSLGHFSQAFHDVFGCCPGLYPLFPKNSNGSAKAKSVR